MKSVIMGQLTEPQVVPPIADPSLPVGFASMAPLPLQTLAVSALLDGTKTTLPTLLFASPGVEMA